MPTDTQNRTVLDTLMGGLKAVLMELERTKGIGVEYCSSQVLAPDAEAIVKETRWLTSWMVEGGNEGFYIHIGGLEARRSHTVFTPAFREIALVKVITSEDAALEVAAVVTRFMLDFPHQMARQGII